MNLENTFTRLKNDVNGNPRYYVGAYDLAALVGVAVDDLPQFARKAGFKKYRGNKYGAGYVTQSYNLSHSVEALRRAIEKDRNKIEVWIDGAYPELKE